MLEINKLDKVKVITIGPVTKSTNSQIHPSGITCFKCNELGHFARDCKNKKQRRKSESEVNQSKKKDVLKRKGVEETESNAEKVVKAEPKEFDYNNVNFKNFGTKKGEDKDFNPNNSEKENSKKGGKKKQQFQKRGNRSHTFKKS